MKYILVLGAGLSSSYLIKYLLEHAAKEQWQVTVADTDRSAAAHKINGHSAGRAEILDATDPVALAEMIKAHDLVISLLPPFMHTQVAGACIVQRRHLITASYVSPGMKELHQQASDAGVLLLNEMGLDPGIDHMSAMQLIDEISRQGGKITAFRSYCGGLVSPEFDDNPWHYKFTWNPRNVVLAGQFTARYLEKGKLKFIPPARIFSQTETVEIPGYGLYDGYANRDSLEYIEPYGIHDAKTVLRGTLRNQGYCESWNLIVGLGLNDDSFLIHDADELTYREWLSAFLPGGSHGSPEKAVSDLLQISESSPAFERLKWLGLFEEAKIPFREATPAQILQHLLQQKWALRKGELDLVLMQHLIDYEIPGRPPQRIKSSLAVKGESESLTAMSKTVGLPMAVAAKLIISGKIMRKGVCIPVTPDIYDPVLQELKSYDIAFSEETSLL